MATESQIREQLVNYLSGESSLDSFDDWLSAETWNIHQTGDVGAEKLTFAIELLLSEHSSGHVSDEQLDDELKTLLRDFAASVTVGAAQSVVVEKTASATLHPVAV
jgi:hypothetical protein